MDLESHSLTSALLGVPLNRDYRELVLRQSVNGTQYVFTITRQFGGPFSVRSTPEGYPGTWAGRMVSPLNRSRPTYDEQKHDCFVIRCSHPIEGWSCEGCGPREPRIRPTVLLWSDPCGLGGWKAGDDSVWPLRKPPPNEAEWETHVPFWPNYPGTQLVRLYGDFNDDLLACGPNRLDWGNFFFKLPEV